MDTVGAGDGFAVGVISAMLEQLTVVEAVKRGNAIGALAVMSPGDMDGLPTREGLEKFMNASV
ncbi:2-dehydro-3-deoxygluconokinase [compost metagenome]